MTGIGFLWRKMPPKTINWAYGYRTSWSMKTKETWDFAHKYVAKLWIYAGVVLTVISAILLIFFRNRDIDTLGGIVTVISISQLACLFLLIIPVEIALRKNFDKSGKRK
jgi:uncharacterized membrane protein